MNESTSTEEAPTDGFPWEKAELFVDITAWLMALPCAVGNWLCYLTCGLLPESTTGYLMKHLAIWDIVSQQASVLVPLMMDYGYKVPTLHVSF